MTNNRYSNGKIYKLVSDIDDKFFVGSTCMTLRAVLCRMKQNAWMHPQLSVYAHFNGIGWGTVRAILIEDYPCANKLQLQARERYHYDLLHPQLSGKLIVPVCHRVKQTRLAMSEHNRLKRFQCICGKSVSVMHRNKHFTTSVHLDSYEIPVWWFPE